MSFEEVCAGLDQEVKAILSKNRITNVASLVALLSKDPAEVFQTNKFPHSDWLTWPFVCFQLKTTGLLMGHVSSLRTALRALAAKNCVGIWAAGLHRFCLFFAVN